MSLIVTIEGKDTTVVMGDVLLSSKEQYSQIELPTREKFYAYSDPPKSLPSSFVQKITFINLTKSHSPPSRDARGRCLCDLCFLSFLPLG